MSGRRQPTEVVVANGRKHLTKAEIAEREAREVKLPTAKTAKPPKWLPEALRKDFRALGKKLIAAGLFTELDGDTLGRYLVAHQEYLLATKQVFKAYAEQDPEAVEDWTRMQDRHFKQARSCANDMGLTVTSRCRLVVPEGLGASESDENPMLALIQGGLSREA